MLLYIRCRFPYRSINRHSYILPSYDPTWIELRKEHSNAYLYMVSFESCFSLHEPTKMAYMDSKRKWKQREGDEGPWGEAKHLRKHVKVKGLVLLMLVSTSRYVMRYPYIDSHRCLNLHVFFPTYPSIISRFYFVRRYMTPQERSFFVTGNFGGCVLSKLLKCPWHLSLMSLIKSDPSIESDQVIYSSASTRGQKKALQKVTITSRLR